MPKARQGLGVPQSQGAHLPQARVYPPHAAKTMQSKMMFPDRLLGSKIIKKSPARGLVPNPMPNLPGGLAGAPNPFTLSRSGGNNRPYRTSHSVQQDLACFVVQKTTAHRIALSDPIESRFKRQPHSPPEGLDRDRPISRSAGHSLRAIDSRKASRRRTASLPPMTTDQPR
jgi:hypothetical protein